MKGYSTLYNNSYTFQITEIATYSFLFALVLDSPLIRLLFGDEEHPVMLARLG